MDIPPNRQKGNPLPGNKAAAIEKAIKKTNSILSAIGASMLFVLMLLGAADVIGRYLFNKPIIGAQEIGTVLLGTMVFISWGSTQIARAHVNVELFTPRFPPRVRAIANFVITFLSFILFSLIVWQAAMIGKDFHEAGRLIYVIHWPLAPFQFLVSFGALVLCLVFIMQMIESFSQIKKRG
jgi:TRAP-type C4-dicarboxylate transport system permease small subunit